jgi:hypothetical protein
MAVLPTPASPTNRGLFFLPPAEHLDGAVDLRFAADEGVDLALTRLLVEVDAIGLQRVALFLRVVAGLGVGVVLGPAHRPRFRETWPLGNAVADVIDRVISRHVLLLQEIGGMAFPFGEDGHQNVGAGHLLSARRLHVDDRALNHPLEPRRGLGVVAAVGDQIFEFGLQIRGQAPAQPIQVHAAGAHDGRGVGVVQQREQQMLERGIFMMPFVGERQRPVQRLLEIA